MLDRGAGHLTAGAAGRDRPDRPPLRAGDAGDRDDLGDADTGWVVVRDALTIGEWATADGKGSRPETGHESDRSLLRTMTCIDGEVEMEMECLPRFDYGLEAATLERRRAGRGGAPAARTGPSCG